jgi:hypothetical protein
LGLENAPVIRGNHWRGDNWRGNNSYNFTKSTTTGTKKKNIRGRTTTTIRRMGMGMEKLFTK